MSYTSLTPEDLKKFSASSSPTKEGVNSAAKVSKGNNISGAGYSTDDNKIKEEAPELKDELAENLKTAEQIIGSSTTTKDTYLGAAEYNDPSLESSFRCLEFKSPYDLISFYDSEIVKGTIALYPWQMDINDAFGNAKCDKMHAFKFALCAANGSGKDAFIVAPIAVWLALCKVQSRTIITSSSGGQLGIQTEGYIRNLCQKVNEFHGQEIFRIRQRYIYCRLSGSEIRLFATDEEGKAEGYHPITPNAVMAIIVNEAKSVDPKIFRALRRCTGYSYWLEVSSPGAPFGDFHTHFKHGIEGTANWSSRLVDYTECPHSNEEERKEDLLDLGEHSALYRSKWLALFTAVDTASIITQDVIDRNVSLSKSGSIVHTNKDWINRIGIDIAAGGDETSMYNTKGNTIVGELHFREKDTTISASRINDWLIQQSIPKAHESIFADDGGVGKAVIDMLVSHYGWTVRRVNNQSPASDKKKYINRGAENWYRVARIFQENLWYFPFSRNEANQKLIMQLCNRRYKQQSSTGRIALESKAEAKSNGFPSPDRADALVLSLIGLSPSDFLNNSNDNKEKTEITARQKLMQSNAPKLRSLAEVENWHQEDRYKQYQDGIYGDGDKKPIKGSMMGLVKARMGNRNN